MTARVLITGVSSGIGHALADQYLSRADRVLGVSRRTPSDLVDHPNFKFATMDLTEVNAVQSGLPKLLDSVSELNTVVLNAGILGEVSDMKDSSLSDLRALMDVNVWANKIVLDSLFTNCPSIERVIAISSGAAVNGNRGWSGYSISKAALNMLIMLYARENEDTFFASVAPGLVDTAMQDYLCGQTDDSRYPSLDALKSKRGTDEMPDPPAAARKLIAMFDSIEKFVPSGGFVDIRHLPEFA